MDKRRSRFLRSILLQPFHHALCFGHVFCPGVSIPFAPALDLPLHIAFGLAQVGETGGFQVHGVKVCLEIDQVLAQRFRLVGVEFDREFAGGHMAVQVFHDEETGPKNVRVFFHMKNLGNHGKMRAHRFQDSRFTNHVVGCGGFLSRRRPSHHQGLLTRFQLCGQIGDPTGERFDRHFLRIGEIWVDLLKDGTKGVQVEEFTHSVGVRESFEGPLGFECQSACKERDPVGGNRVSRLALSLSTKSFGSRGSRIDVLIGRVVSTCVDFARPFVGFIMSRLPLERSLRKVRVAIAEGISYRIVYLERT